jgi:hypothetical protein
VAAGSALVQSGCIFFSVGGNKLTKGKIIDMPFLSFFKKNVRILDLLQCRSTEFKEKCMTKRGEA